MRGYQNLEEISSDALLSPACCDIFSSFNFGSPLTKFQDFNIFWWELWKKNQLINPKLRLFDSKNWNETESLDALTLEYLAKPRVWNVLSLRILTQNPIISIIAQYLPTVTCALCMFVFGTNPHCNYYSLLLFNFEWV